MYTYYFSMTLYRVLVPLIHDLRLGAAIAQAVMFVLMDWNDSVPTICNALQTVPCRYAAVMVVLASACTVSKVTD